MTTLISLSDPDLPQKIQKLRPTSGYLLMADLVGSTELKRGKDFKVWAADFLFPFENLQNNISNLANISHGATKVVGDMVMYWFPQSDNPDPQSIMEALVKVQMESERGFKMAFVRVENVYEVSFHEKVPEDVYGSDIDLAARLLECAKAKEIRMNAACKVAIDGRVAGIDSFSNRIEGPERLTLKGFDDPIKAFVWRPG